MPKIRLTQSEVARLSSAQLTALRNMAQEDPSNVEIVMDSGPSAEETVAKAYSPRGGITPYEPNTNLVSSQNIGKTVSNAARSTLGVLGDLGSMALDPVGTAKGLYEAGPSGLWDVAKERYGSWENIKRSIVEDPAGVAVDILPTAGGIIGKLAKRGLKASAAARAGESIWHGTTESAARDIVNSGFNPAKGVRQYDYSVAGKDATYFTRNAPGEEWLAAEGAGRGVPYTHAVEAKLNESANVLKIDTPRKLEQLAQNLGMQNSDELSRKWWVDGLSESGPIETSASDAVTQQLRKLGIDAIEITNDADRAILSGSFGGNQIIVLNPQAVKAVGYRAISDVPKATKPGLLAGLSTKTLGRTAKVARAMEVVDPTRSIPAATSATVRGAKSFTENAMIPSVTGIFTGTDTDVARRVYEAGKTAEGRAHVQSVRSGTMKGTDIEGAFIDAFKARDTKLSDQFGRLINEMWQRSGSVPIDLTGVQNNLIENVRRTLRGAVMPTAPGSLPTINWSVSKIAQSPLQQRIITKLYETVHNWDNTTAQGINDLKESLGAFIKNTSVTRQSDRIVADTRNKIRAQLSAIPRYDKIEAAYANTRKGLDQLSQSMGYNKYTKTVNHDTVLKRLSQTVKDSDSFREEYLAAFEKRAKVPFSTLLAAMDMTPLLASNLFARSLASGALSGMLGYAAGNPVVGMLTGLALGVPLTSPKTWSHFLTAMGATAGTAERGAQWMSTLINKVPGGREALKQGLTAQELLNHWQKQKERQSRGPISGLGQKGLTQ